MILIDANENPLRYPASYNSPSQVDLSLPCPPPKHPSAVAEPPPYEGGRYTSGRYAEATESTTETRPPVQPQYSQPSGSLPLSPESSPSSPPLGVISQFTGTNSASSSGSPTSSSITEPLPSSFLRQPPGGLSYDPFQPMFLIANGKFLDKGFPPVRPPSAAQPHPFVSHDVTDADWTWFIDVLRKVATISDKQYAIASSIPLVQDVPVVNILVSNAIKKYMRKKKRGPAGDLVNRWNHHFFHPRRMEVVLMHGQTKLSGGIEVPIQSLHTTNNSSASSSPTLSPSSPQEDKRLPNSQAWIESTAKEKYKDREEDHDRIYRLYVVPL